MRRLSFLLLLALPAVASAQEGGFVVLLGRDTVQVERFTRTGQAVEGTVVFRAPVTRFVKYRLQLRADGTPERYEQSLFTGRGVPITPNAANATFTFTRDSLTRTTVRGSEPVTQTIAMPAGLIPTIGASAMIPFAYSWLTYELALPGIRQRAQAGDTRIVLIGTSPNQVTAQQTRVWLVGSDSMEMDYFGVARSGFRFNASGQLVRADWSQTTYKYSVARVASVDVEMIARAWSQQDESGKGFGTYSPRDTARAEIANASVLIDYSRPSARGRDIWGGVVPWDGIWRIGADMATQLITDVPLDIGGVVVPAGKYSLWMVASRTAPMLVINRQSGQFGTQYDVRQDLARVSLARESLAVPVERLTLGIGKGVLRIDWGSSGYTVPVRVSR